MFSVYKLQSIDSNIGSNCYYIEHNQSTYSTKIRIKQLMHACTTHTHMTPTHTHTHTSSGMENKNDIIESMHLKPSNIKKKNIVVQMFPSQILLQCTISRKTRDVTNKKALEFHTTWHTKHRTVHT